MVTAPIGWTRASPAAAALAENLLGDTRVIVHGVGVRHAGHGGEPAGHRGRRAAGDRLLVLLAGLAQVDVHVDEAGTHNEAGRHRDHDGSLRRQITAHALDDAAAHEEVARAVDPLSRIDDPGALEEQGLLVAQLRCRRHAPPSSTPASR